VYCIIGIVFELEERTMFDNLRAALWVGLFAMIVGVVCLAWVAWANSGSRNLALATGTLVAALILFVVQLPFELSSSIRNDFFSAEFTIDRATPQIRQWKYPNKSGAGTRLGLEVGASNYLNGRDPSQFNGDRVKLTNDMVVFSILAYFGSRHSDWQLKHLMFRGQSAGTLTISQRVSGPNDCTIFSTDKIEHRLAAAGNVFAGANIFFGPRELCLPPNSTLSISPNSLVIENPFCKLSLGLEQSGGVAFTEPGTGGNVPQLSNSEPRYETRVTGVRAIVEFSWIRAQHRDLKKYQDWIDKVFNGLNVWFEDTDNS
jgi:hypothetical protein